MKKLHSRTRKLRRTSCAIAAAVASTAISAVPQPPRVVLIHGIWDTARSLRKMDAAIRAAGCETLMVTLTPNDGSAPLDELGCEVRTQINAKFGNAGTFSIVGFSMGGLVARSYMRQFGNPARISSLITIASPHHGTLLGWMSAKPGIVDMRPGSDFLRRVDEDRARFSRTSWTTIRTPFDLAIVPSASSVIDGATNIVVPTAMHPLLMSDRRVISATLHALGVSRTSEPVARVSRHAGSLPRRIPGIPPLPTAFPAGQ